jgi:hypothetical protein
MSFAPPDPALFLPYQRLTGPERSAKPPQDRAKRKGAAA